jgi:hypothetical protein
MTMFGKMAAEKTKPGKREIYDEDGTFSFSLCPSLVEC